MTKIRMIEAHTPGTRWSTDIRVSFSGEDDPNNEWVEDYEGQSVWNFFDDLSDVLPPREAIEKVPERYKEAFKDYCAYYGMRIPDESKKESREPIPPYKKDIVIRGGNHHMKPDSIYFRVPYSKLVEMGIVKDGEEPGSSAARAIRNALKVDIKEIPDTRFGGNDYYMTISIGDISKEYYLEEYWFSKNKNGFIPWLLDSHLTIRPEDPWESKSEAVALNRITMKDARKALDKLQKDGTLDKALHEITALHSFVGNYLANTDPDVTDNKLNSPERKIVARAVLAHLAEQFGYQPEDLR